MQKNTYFTAIIFAVGIGVFLFHIVEDTFLAFLILILFSNIVGIFLIILRKKTLFLLSLFCMIGFVFGVLYASFFFQKIEKQQTFLGQYVGQYVKYEGKIQSIHTRSDFYNEYRIKLLKIEEKNMLYDIDHLLRLPKNFNLSPGETLIYQGKLGIFEDFNGFSYEKYMLSQGIYFYTSSSKVETLSVDTTSFHSLLASLRQDLLSTLSALFPNEEAIFLGGILFGARENLPADLKEDFNNSGLTHFIAVSGFNITLCVIFVSFLFGFLPVWGRIITTSSCIILFSFFVGGGAPVVRAALMGIIGYFFLQSGTTPKNITILVFTAGLMIFWSPLSLNYDVSLHLSFLAVIGIMYTQTFFKKIFFWLPEIFAIREAAALTLSALSFTLPIMIFQFGQISLLSPLANVAVTWTIPLAMLGGSVTLVGNIISPLLGQFLGFFTWILLHYDIMMVRLFGNLEFAILKIDVGAYKNYFQVLYFFILIYLLCLVHFKKKKQSF